MSSDATDNTMRAEFEAWAVRTGRAYRDSQRGLVCYDALPEASAWAAWQAARAQPEPLVWRSTTPCYVAFVTDRRYRKFSPAVQKWYEPVFPTCADVARQVAKPDDDLAIEVAAALEVVRALHIVADVAALPIGGRSEQFPTAFHAGYRLACDEIAERLRPAAPQAGETKEGAG